MNKDNEKWIEAIFQSMKSSESAKPSAELFNKIEVEISAANVQIIPIYKWKRFVAVAAMLLLLNGAALIYYNNKEVSNSNVTTADTYHLLNTMLQIYE